MPPPRAPQSWVGIRPRARHRSAGSWCGTRRRSRVGSRRARSHARSRPAATPCSCGGGGGGGQGGGGGGAECAQTGPRAGRRSAPPAPLPRGAVRLHPSVNSPTGAGDAAGQGPEGRSRARGGLARHPLARLGLLQAADRGRQLPPPHGRRAARRCRGPARAQPARRNGAQGLLRHGALARRRLGRLCGGSDARRDAHGPLPAPRQLERQWRGRRECAAVGGGRRPDGNERAAAVSR